MTIVSIWHTFQANFLAHTSCPSDHLAMLNWTLKEYDLQLKYNWKIHEGEASSKKIFILSASDSHHTGLGEIAGVTEKIQTGQYDIPNLFNGHLEQLKHNPTKLTEDHNIPAPFRMAIDEAYHSLLAQQQNATVSKLLKLESSLSIPTAYALPILPITELSTFYQQHLLERFHAVKVKIDGTTPAEYIQEIHQLHKGEIWIDANQGFQSVNSALDFVGKLKNLPITLLEQPFRAQDIESHRLCRRKSPFPLIADESIQDLELSPQQIEAFDGVNVKLLKAGSYKRAIQQMQTAKKNNLKVMLGCMVETTVGISSALNIASLADYHDLDGFLYFQNLPHQLAIENNGQIYPKV